MGQKGYIALSSVLVIGAVVTIVSATVALFSVNDIQSSLAGKKGSETLGLIEGCVEDALLQLYASNAIASTITIPEGTCSVTINSQVGNDWTFTVSGTINGYAKSIQVTAVRGSTITITSWREP